MIFDNNFLNIILLLLLFKIFYDFNNNNNVEKFDSQNKSYLDTKKYINILNKDVKNIESRDVQNINKLTLPYVYNKIKKLTTDLNTSSQDGISIIAEKKDSQPESIIIASESNPIKSEETYYLEEPINKKKEKYKGFKLLKHVEKIGAFTVLDNEDYYLKINKS